MAKRKSNNQGKALADITEVLACARRVAVHSPAHDHVEDVAGVPGIKLYKLRLALERAGVDMGKARNNSVGAFKASEAVRASKLKRN